MVDVMFEFVVSVWGVSIQVWGSSFSASGCGCRTAY